MLKSAHIKFKDPKYNYSTSVNGNISDEEIKKYFINKPFNLGYISYDHKENKEIEIDNVQICINCEITTN